MDHLASFLSRSVRALPIVNDRGWQLKRYAIVSEARVFDAAIADAATAEAVRRLPPAGDLQDAAGNHGVGVQIVHFAQVAVVAPVFYWQWGSVLANLPQLRASWDRPMDFDTGVSEVVGCVWEIEVVAFEVDMWKNTMLSSTASPDVRLSKYLQGVLT